MRTAQTAPITPHWKYIRPNSPNRWDGSVVHLGGGLFAQGELSADDRQSSLADTTCRRNRDFDFERARMDVALRGGSGYGELTKLAVSNPYAAKIAQ